MAKKDKQAKKDKSGGTAADTVDAIRSVIERTLEGAGLTEKRQREVVEQVSAAAGRIRQTLDDLRVVDEVHELRAQLETLAARVAELETEARSAKKPAARKPAATSTRASTAKKPAARSRAAKPATPASATRAKSTGTTPPRNSRPRSKPST